MAATADPVPGTEMSAFAHGTYVQKYAFKDDQGNVIENWADTAHRVASNVLGALGITDEDPEFYEVFKLIVNRQFMPGGRYLYASGRPLHQTQNCLLLRADDSREGWADVAHKAMMALMTGAGIGIDYSDVRPKGSPIEKTGGIASGPISLMQIINEAGRHIMQGGSRRSAIWAGLRWDHGDIFDFIKIKDWDDEIKAKKAEDFNYPAPLDMTNVSIILNDEFFEAYEDEHHEKHWLAQKVYRLGVRAMVSTAEPGFSVDTGENAGETLRNACTEVTSADDSDICNLGSLNLARFDSVEEFEAAIRPAVLFLLAGTVYSHVPYDDVNRTRQKNRRLGLGLMGIHEWLLKRGYKYEPNDELATWLSIYATSTKHAHQLADHFGLSRPVKTRAIAPTGTIGIIAETTTGIEPVFCVAFKRRYLVDGTVWKHQYVIDPTAERLIRDGVSPEEIEDAYSLAFNVEKRIAFQAWVQQYVDHGISSTINLPYPITDDAEAEDFGRTLYGYLPKLRGITCYPDGSRGGQPLTSVPYELAKEKVGVVFEESEERCKAGACGI